MLTNYEYVHETRKAGSIFRANVDTGQVLSFGSAVSKRYVRQKHSMDNSKNGSVLEHHGNQGAAIHAMGFSGYSIWEHLSWPPKAPRLGQRHTLPLISAVSGTPLCSSSNFNQLDGWVSRAVLMGPF